MDRHAYGRNVRKNQNPEALMEFDSNKPIYIQIADNICDRILKEEFKSEERIPSVREWGAGIGVNPNTVARSYELLTEMGVIFNKRGIGFFVCEDAVRTIREQRKEVFLKEELPALIKKADLLGVDLLKALEESRTQD